jgi:hypothetical protein
MIIYVVDWGYFDTINYIIDTILTHGWIRTSWSFKRYMIYRRRLAV